ncbi:MAG: alanyl-tRNA editing protein [Candidatus Protochlamydia sp.]|nr:alanyl-tRNA editing protein [Candidatus Protochlamydia sp.]
MTIPLYLQNAYLKEAEATILDVIKESDKKWQIIMDQTIFYPRGGGQSTDQGFLFTNIWKGKVSQALLKEDKIIHYVESDQPPSDTLLKMAIDWDRRYLHMRLHSAGHVVDFALYLMGYCPKLLMPLKGDHGKKALICYQGIVNKDFREELERLANDLVTRNLDFSFRLIDHDELEKETIYLQPGLPKNKPLRLLTLSGVGSVADGGTQVNKTSEIGKISILPIEIKDEMTLIHYRLV